MEEANYTAQFLKVNKFSEFFPAPLNKELEGRAKGTWKGRSPPSAGGAARHSGAGLALAVGRLAGLTDPIQKFLTVAALKNPVAHFDQAGRFNANQQGR